MFTSLRRTGARRWALAGVAGALSLGLAGFAFTSPDAESFSPVANDLPRGGTVKAGPPDKNTYYLLHTAIPGVNGSVFDVTAVDGKGGKGKGEAGGEAAAEAPEKKNKKSKKNGKDKNGKNKNGKNKNGKNKGKDKNDKNAAKGGFTGEVKMDALENGDMEDVLGSPRAFKLQWWYPRDIKTVGKSYQVRWENMVLKGQCLAGNDKNIGLKPCSSKDKEQQWLHTPMKGLHGYKTTSAASKLSMATKLTSKNIVQKEKVQGFEVLVHHPIPDIFPKKLAAKPAPGELFYWDDCNCGRPEI